MAPDQIRTIIRAFKDALFTDLFPGRTHVPKTLIFAKDDSHADEKEMRDTYSKAAREMRYHATTFLHMINIGFSQWRPPTGPHLR